LDSLFSQTQSDMKIDRMRPVLLRAAGSRFGARRPYKPSVSRKVSH